MLNQIIIHGRLTANPTAKEIKGKNGEITVSNFTVAVSDDFDQERTTFFKCTAFGATAGVINDYFTKGQEIIVHGKMVCDEVKQDDDYIDYYWKLLAEKIDFCGKPTKKRMQKKQRQKQEGA